MQRIAAWLVGVLLNVSVYGQTEAPVLLIRAFGDVNLGRAVGQELLKGNVDYPFAEVREWLQQADIVFVNLESQLTDQGGETQHPKDQYVFCGPPVGAQSLKRAGITIVSTANNHAYDYRMKGLRETIRSLQEEGVQYVGTSADSVSLFPPVVVQRNGMRVGFVAYTEFVNIAGSWKGRISTFDRNRVKREMDSARQVSDLVIASYHGGSEYTDEPQELTRAQMRFLADAGADVVLGHHAHVPQGIEERNGRLILYSLGNFVFSQPQHLWTQTGLGVELVVARSHERVTLREVRLHPVRAGRQPTLILSHAERAALRERLQRLSNVTIDQQDSFFVIRHQQP
jgi:poly-gamma-glutamate synthesis protein (capsule biosynthesis protein)